MRPLHDGEITVKLLGPEDRDDYGHYYTTLTDWRNVKINGKTVSTGAMSSSFQKGFSKQISCKKDEVLHVEAEFRRHHFTIHDFTRLNSGKVWYLITGNLLFFALIYRLLGLIRGGGIRRSDAFFLTIFFISLFIPMIGISNAVKSVRESRMLAVKPEMKEIFKKGSDYGRKYEQWFNDHFCGHVGLTKLHNVIRNKLSIIIRTERWVCLKDSGWMFSIRDRNFRSSSTQSIIRNLITLNRFCQSHQIKFYVFEVPGKEDIYKEILKERYGFDEQKFIKVFQAREALRNEAQKNHVSWIYPYKALCEAAKKDLVFFKASHHWSDWGAFVGYCELMKEITKDFPNLPVVSLNDYRKTSNRLIRDEWHRDYFLWLPQRFFNFRTRESPNLTLSTYYDHENSDKMVIRVGKYTKDFTYPLENGKIMLLGTSQNENFCQFLPYTAKRTRYIRLNRGQVKIDDEFKVIKLYKKDILTFKPDILILSIHTDNLLQLRDLCSTK